MPTGPLTYKILVFATISAGLLALLADLMSRRRRCRRSRPAAAAGQTADADSATNLRQTDEQWRRDLTPEQYAVIRRGVTERPFTGLYWDHFEEGVYHCAGCGAALFNSAAKFHSDTGWPSFREPVVAAAVAELKSISYGRVCTEVVCRRCEAHLGHLFTEGAPPKGRRYSINSLALDFSPAVIEIEAAAGE